MALSGLSHIVQQLATLNASAEPIENVPHAGPQGGGDYLARPLTDLVYIEVDPNWLASHPNIAEDYRARLTFTFIDLEAGITEMASPQYGSTDIIGRAEAYKTFSGTSNKEVQMSFQFHAQGLGGGHNHEEIIQKEVVRPTRFIDSLKYPIDDPITGLSFAPPPILLKIGQLMTARCILTESSMIWKEPVDPVTLLPEQSEVSCTFTVVRQVPKNYLSAHGPIEGNWQ